MSKGGVNMVTKDEQTEFFETIFAPLEKISTPPEIKNAKKRAFEFVEGVTFGDINNDIIGQWDLRALKKQQADSWKWLIAMRLKYPEFNENENIEIHKFVWHKKPDEVGWGPKLVIEVKGSDRKFLYITKPMDDGTIKKITEVGTKFNLFQPPQQAIDHEVKRVDEQAEDFTIFMVVADQGETLEKEFERIIESFDIQSMDVLFQKIIELYLQDTIDDIPALGFVAPIKYGKEWKYGYEWTEEKNPQLKFLRDFEKTAPFLVPLRWENKEQTRVITLLHGDEWGGNFMAPPSDAGSIRPIDFEDAHIQHVEVGVDEQNNLQSYLATSQGEGSHLSAGGELAYRVTSRWSGEAPPLHAYSAMSALGRLFAALVQKQTLKTDPQEIDIWIEEVTARFFNALRKSLKKFTTSSFGTKYLSTLNLEPEVTQRSLLVRAVLAAYDWSEHWTYKDRDQDDYDDYYQGKWKTASLEEFQFQLLVQGETEFIGWEFQTRFHMFYLPILEDELNSGLWNDVEKQDIRNCINYVDRQLLGAREKVPIYQELTMLKSLEVPIFNRIEIRFEPPVSKYDSLVNKINIINIHQIATTNSNQFQNPYLSDRDLMKRVKKELQSGLWNKHFVMEIEDWMHGEIPFDHVAIPQIHNFQSRDEVWIKHLFEKIIGIESIGYMNETLIAQQLGKSLPSRAKEITDSIDGYVHFIKSFSSRSYLIVKSRPVLLDSTILQTTSKISGYVVEFFKNARINAQDIIILTKLLEIAANEDPTNIQIDDAILITTNAIKATNYLKLNFAKQGFSNFAEYLGPCIKKLISYCSQNPEIGNEVMANTVNWINQECKNKLLRDWFITFRSTISGRILGPHENQPWHKSWFSMK